MHMGEYSMDTRVDFLQSVRLQVTHKGDLKILTGMSLLILQIICLSLGQFASPISSPPSNTVGVISVLLK